MQAAQPTIAHLNQFAKPTPELAQNLAIVGHDLDDRSRAVEADPRSPHGQGYTGLEAVLQYVFNQTLAINTFGPFGHQLAVDAFVSAMCTPYATPGTIAQNLKTFGSAYRSCYSWLGPNQPGVTTTDPSNPSACVPDPGGAPPGQTGLPATVCKSKAADVARAATSGGKQARSTTRRPTGRPSRRRHQRARRPRPPAGRAAAGRAAAGRRARRVAVRPRPGRSPGCSRRSGRSSVPLVAARSRRAAPRTGPRPMAGRQPDRPGPLGPGRPSRAVRQPGPAAPQLPARAMRRSQATHSRVRCSSARSPC